VRSRTFVASIVPVVATPDANVLSIRLFAIWPASVAANERVMNMPRLWP
jgi:hypothetical protein